MSIARHKNPSHKYAQAKKLRSEGSMVEKLLRKALREQAKSFDIKFRYQYPISPYIADFVCLPVRLIVEVDGMSHDATVKKDQKREAFLISQGFHILHFSNNDVLKDTMGVAFAICAEAQRLRLEQWESNTPPRICSANSTLPQGEGGVDSSGLANV